MTELNRTEGFSGSLLRKESTCNTGDLGSVPGLGMIGQGWDDPLEKGKATHSSILA